MYEIQFVVPTLLANESRINDFLNLFGMYNSKNHKIRLFLLVGKEKVLNNMFYDFFINKGNIDLEIINCKSNNAVFKVYDFFGNLEPEKIKEAKWTAKIDDDSYNDIDAMIKTLSMYNHEDKHYIISGPKVMHDINQNEQICLNELGLDEIIKDDPAHEIEASWVSQRTMLDIISNQDCLNLFKCRKSIPYGYTDQCLAFAAKITGAEVIKEDLFYAALKLTLPFKNFSIFGGLICHVHPFCFDKTPIEFGMVKSKMEQIIPQEHKDFIDQFFILEIKDKKIQFKLKPYGIVEHRVIVNWAIIKDKMVLMNFRGETLSFDLNELKAGEAVFANCILKRDTNAKA